MDEKELEELEKYFSKTYGTEHIVPPERVKPIDVEKAKLLFSLRIPICFFDQGEHVVCVAWNPFKRSDRQWYAWVDKEQDDEEAT